MVWSSAHISTLIEEYQKYPCLYAVKHPLHRNRNARANALTKICEVLCELRPETTIEEIKTKFSSLRTTFLSEKRKMEKAIKSGAGVDCVYVPSLWYFEKISYLTEHVTPRPSKSNLDACEEQESHNVLSPIIRERKNKNTIHLVEDVQEYVDQNNLLQISCDETKDSKNEQKTI
nr:uncharacterized protein LOC111513051 [Leptinotarsa decemlineata]